MENCLCIGNLPKLMHAKLKSDLENFLKRCEVKRIHLLTGKNFCFVTFKNNRGFQDAKDTIKSQSFNGKVLRLENKNIEEYVKVPTINGTTNKNDETYEIEVLDIPHGTRREEILAIVEPYGAVDARIAPPIGKLWVAETKREEAFLALNNFKIKNRSLRCRYPPFIGQRPSQYKPTDTCRIIVEGITSPERSEIQDMLKARFLSFGHISGVEIMRNREPAYAFVDIERNMASIASEAVDNEYFFGSKITVALMRQEDVIVLDSDDEAKMDTSIGINLEGAKSIMANLLSAQSSQPQLKTPLPPSNLLPSEVKPPRIDQTTQIVELMCERERLEVLHPYEEYLIQVAPPEGSVGLDDAEPLPNPPQQFIRLLMDRALVRTKLLKLANTNK